LFFSTPDPNEFKLGMNMAHQPVLVLALVCDLSTSIYVLLDTVQAACLKPRKIVCDSFDDLDLFSRSSSLAQRKKEVVFSLFLNGSQWNVCLLVPDWYLIII